MRKKCKCKDCFEQWFQMHAVLQCSKDIENTMQSGLLHTI